MFWKQEVCMQVSMSAYVDIYLNPCFYIYLQCVFTESVTNLMILGVYVLSQDADSYFEWYAAFKGNPLELDSWDYYPV